MSMKTFEKHLDRYGAKFEDWPEEAARDARLLLIRSDEARRCYGAFLRVESWLDSSRPSIDSVCATRVVARALRDIRNLPPRRSLFDRFALPFAVPAPLLAFAVVATAVGFAVGLLLGSPGADRTARPHGLPVIASADDVLF